MIVNLFQTHRAKNKFNITMSVSYLINWTSTVTVPSTIPLFSECLPVLIKAISDCIYLVIKQQTCVIALNFELDDKKE